jgi:hypothetical protein
LVHHVTGRLAIVVPYIFTGIIQFMLGPTTYRRS